MNRRTFITSSITSAICLPFVSLSAPTLKNKLVKEETYRVLECSYELLPLSYLSMNKIRNAIYTASAVDKNGKFAHEDGFVGEFYGDSPFIGKGHRIKCLPIIYSTNRRDLSPIIGKINSGVILKNGYDKNTIIQEVKANMEYVCFVGYALTSNTEKGDRFFVPIMRGLSKRSYHIKVDIINAKTKEEVELVYKKYNV